MKKLLYIFTSAPYSSVAGQEGVDAVMVAAAFEQEVSVLFINDGVFQLLMSQTDSNGLRGQYTKRFKALDDFGVENVYVHEPSMLSRGVVDQQLVIQIDALSNVAVTELIAGQDQVLIF